MGEMNQEPEFEIPNHEEDDDDLKLQESMNLSLLDLDNPQNDQQNRHLCSSCACNITAFNPMKRSPQSISEPKSKKALLENPKYSTSGYSKIPLPQLYHSVSDPITPTKTSLSETPKALEDTPLSKGTASSSLPPKGPSRPNLLSRSISEPIVSPVKSLSRTSSSLELGGELIKEESHSAKRLKMMKEKMEVMNNWLGEAMKEVEEVLCTTVSEAAKDDGDLDSEEAVSVKKVGECLDLNFNCPCGKGYKILLTGNNCYYKLI